ncbi:MAG: YihY/virulence factor BrkB family protein [Aquificae bacterium]|nr:YihY/virulence factor BrkB family protein [Aquificota bacterium]
MVRLLYRALYALLADFFSKNYTYHASAITFSAFLVLNAVVVFLGTVLKYVPGKEEVVARIYELFPEASAKVVDFLVRSVENLTVQTQVLTLLLVVFFLGNFLRTVEYAFAFVSGGEPRKIPLVNYFLPFIFGLLLLLYGVVDFAIGLLPEVLKRFHLYHPLVEPVLETIRWAVNYLAFPLGLLVIYRTLSPVPLRPSTTLGVSLLLMLLLNPLKGLFTWYATNFLVKNLVITPFAGILMFLVWLYVLALALLLGYRLILLLDGLKERRAA